eukprot:GHVR01059708.1.p1 GENE.GHVR01059708.1~~GHVR01059708.1.p1  ORF type:complete len:512 (+),score=71.70 GHVR01059708.1:390-1925(+)
MDGYEKCSEGCCRLEEIRPIESCPEGTRRVPREKNKKTDPDEEGCVRLVENQLVQRCSESGFDQCEPFQPGFCCYRKREKALIRCPVGWSLRGITCVSTRTSKAAFICPEGYSPTEDTLLTLRRGRHGGVVGGVHSRSLACTSSQEIPAVLLCPPPMGKTEPVPVGKDGKCASFKIEPVLMTCPAGYAVEAGQCVFSRVVAPVGHSTECPVGYQLTSSHQCELRLTASGSQECPPGYEGGIFPVAGCAQRVTTEPKLYCDEDRHLVDGKCVQYVLEKMDWMCPEGGTVKVSEISRKLSWKEKRAIKRGEEFEIDEDSFVDFDKYEVVTYVRECIQEVVIDADFNCPHGSIVCELGCCTDKTCPAELYCPEGTIPYPDKCISEVWEQFEFHCPRDTFIRPNGMCTHVQVGTFSTNCPEGFNVNAEGLCEKLITEPVSAMCPPTHLFSRAVMKCILLQEQPQQIIPEPEKIHGGHKEKYEEHRVWANVENYESLLLPDEHYIPSIPTRHTYEF